jgi:hypothetical protein
MLSSIVHYESQMCYGFGEYEVGATPTYFMDCDVLIKRWSFEGKKNK